MRRFSARFSFWYIVFSLLLSFVVFFSIPGSIHAQAATETPTPSPPGSIQQGTTNPLSNVWEFSPEVTEVGRNADRARQLLWWVWTHPGIYTAPIIAQLWGITRNIVYVLIVLVLILFGIGIMLGRRRGMPGPVFNGISSPLMGMQIPSVFMKLGMILLYVTFSYIIVLGFIQFSEVSMQFIKALVGKDLFNVFFAGTGNIEANYTTFIGYYNTDPLAREMVNTSLFIIKFTSFTYYAMAIILIMRTIILWFLLILSPFLALLMPFVFIRNTGWIWIGVFFQWLFYGPLMTLFVVALVNIWVAGIPYPFDFTRVNKPEGQVYKTSINILYGGPAQTLSSGNSANYVDTFAEYVIALTMLWVAMLLPWLLLRIFRDYCCSLLASANATMTAIFDRMRQYPPPAPPPPPINPSTRTGMAAELPFRSSVTEKSSSQTYMATARMREISKATTSEIARAMDISVMSLKDVSRLEIREKDRNEVRSTLERISAPERITSSVERERYETVHNELVQRANQGDKVAQNMLMASDRRSSVLAKQVAQIHAEKAFAPSVTKSILSSVSSSITSRASTTDKKSVQAVSKATNVAEEQVQKVIERAMTSKLMTQSKTMSVAQESNVSKEKVQEIISVHNSMASAEKTLQNEKHVTEVAKATQVTDEMVKKVLSSVKERANISQEAISTIAHENNISASKVSDIVSVATTKQTAQSAMSNEQSVKEIATTSNTSTEAVKQVLGVVSQSGVVNKEKIHEIAQQSKMSDEQVSSIVEASKQATVVSKQEEVKSVSSAVAEKVGVSTEQVQKVLDQIPASGKTDEEAMKQTALAVGMAPEKVKEIVAATQQAVAPSIDEYEDVKQMWLSHYREAPVPISDMIKDREGWVEDEQKKLTNILNLLTSTDPQMKQQGLERVAEILPFMLLGGFSETETIAYIQAKLSATDQIKTEIEMKKQIAKEMGVKLQEEQDTLIEVKGVNTQTAQKSQTRTIEMPVSKASGSGHRDDNADDYTSLSDALQQRTEEITRASITAIRDVAHISTQEITKTMQIMVTSLKDISRLEQEKQMRDSVQEELSKIAKPQQAAPADVQQYQLVRDELINRSNKGDKMAQVMLLAGEQKKELMLKQLMEQRPARSSAPTPAAIAAKVGVPESAVQAVLTTLPQPTPGTAVRAIPDEKTVKDVAAKAGIDEGKVKEIVSATSSVSVDDYEAVKQMWVKYYREAPVLVTDRIKTREDWIMSESKTLTNIYDLLNSPDTKMREQGLSQVSEMLPYLLLGGFSDTEMMIYVRAKKEAAHQVLEELSSQKSAVVTALSTDESSKVTIPNPIKAPLVSKIEEKKTF